MSTIEKLSKEFEALTLQEKIDFLNRITPSSEGEWVKTNGDINFFPYEAEFLTEEGEEALQQGHEDIKNDRVKSWDQVKKELEL